MFRVLIVAGSLLVVAQLYRLGGGIISSELHRAFGLGPGEIGVVMGAMFLASALVQLPMGIAFDRFGTRRTVFASALVGSPA
jgi:nitrate/nitrite transporter NarK